LSCGIVFFGGFICFASSKVIKEVLDVTYKTVGIVAGSTIIYKNVKGGGSYSTNDDNEDKDKKDKNTENKTDNSSNETSNKF
jgi:hypothetical protein